MLTSLKLIGIMSMCYASQAFCQVPSGYELWLGYGKVENVQLLTQYKQAATSIYFQKDRDILEAAQKELKKGLSSMLNQTADFTDSWTAANSMVIAKKEGLDKDIMKVVTADLDQVGKEGFVIRSVQLKDKKILVITANTDIGILYGVFRLLRLMKSHETLSSISVVDAPKITLRMLNHWDNLDRTVERGYAGFSLWNWQKLPEYIDQRYIEYARANASIGINAVSLTNVNANALILTPMYMEKVQALANVFRPYGIKVYLTARFSPPIEIGGLGTADPLNREMQQWWNNKAKEIYARIPDFGGFLVKANSEGQPGPQN